ncbi:MAG: beta strand repeat-containing protein, partial [Bythopirellula sp.]
FGRDGRGELYLIDPNLGNVFRIAAGSGASNHTPSDVWVGTVSGNWSVDNDWQDGGAPPVGGGSDQILEFNYLGDGPAPTFSNDLGTPFVANGLILNAAGPVGFTLDGNAVELVNNVAEAPFVEAFGIGTLLVNFDVVATDSFTLTGAGADLTIGGVISGAGGLTVDRVGALTTITSTTTYSGETKVTNSELHLSGTVASSSGVTVEDRGRLTLAYATADDKIGDTASVTLESGEFVVRNDDVSAVTETINQLILKAGTANTVTLLGSAAPMILDADSIVREAGAAVLFRGTDLGEAGASQAHFVTAPALIGGGGLAGSTTISIIPLALADQDDAGEGSSFVTYDAVLGIVPLDTQTEYATAIVSGTTSDDNVNSTGAINDINAATTLNALRIDTGGSLAGSGTLTLTSGSVLASGVNGGIGVTSLELANSESIIWTNEDLTISSAINASDSLTKAGDAQLVVSGATSIPGETLVLGGSLVANGTTFTSSSLSLQGEGSEFIAESGTTTIGEISISRGAQLALTTDQTLTVSGATTVNGDGVLRIDGGTLHTDVLNNVDGRIFFVSGLLDITGSSFEVGAAGPLGSTLILDSAKSVNVSGTTSIAAGTISLNGGTLISDQLVLDGLGATLSATSGTLDVNNMLLSNGAAPTFAAGENVAINQDVVIDSTSTLTLNGGSLAAAQLVNNGGTFDFTAGTLQLTGSGLTISAGEPLGDNVTLDDGKNLDVSGTTTIGPGGTLTLANGSFNTAELIVRGPNSNLALNGISPTVGDFTLTNGATQVLTAAQSLVVSGTTHIQPGSVFSLTGGALTTGDLLVDGALDFQAGTLELTAQGFTVGPDGLFGSILVLASGQHLKTSQDVAVDATGMLHLQDNSSVETAVLTNQGIVELNGLTANLESTSFVNQGVLRGTGRVLADLDNHVLGDVRVQLNERLLLQGVTHTNAGRIEVIGGEIEFIGALTNAAGTGEIVARDATLRFSGGLTNSGSMNLSFGTSDVFGDITNANTIIVSGGSSLTFYDQFVNDGEHRTSDGSTSVFFGSVTGAGTFTGTGTTAFEGDFQPGNIAAGISFSGDVGFGPAASREIEMGGTAPGTEFDMLAIDGLASLDGTLLVDLFDGGAGLFEPAAGDSFEIISAAGGLTGQFTPSLP